METPMSSDLEAHASTGVDSKIQARKTGPELDLLPNKADTPVSKVGSIVKRCEAFLVAYNLEARGLQRVQPDESHPVTWLSYVQAFGLWVSMNLAANNITLGMLGPIIFALSFKDSALCAVFGAMIGSIPVAYNATWGPISGNRTLVFARYTFGWWPTKILVVLNMINLLGYSLIDLVIAGQILSAVSPHGSLSIVVGIIIVGILCWLISTFGIQLFYAYQRFAFMPQIIAISILFGVASNHFDLTSPTQGDSRTRIGNRVSFLSLCLAAAITYSGISADFFVYYSPSTSRIKLFTSVYLGLIFSFTFAFLAGLGLASGVAKSEAYANAYDTSQGALIVEGFSPLNGFGKFLSVVILFSLVANTIGPSYSVGIDFQLLARFAQRVPRFIWNTAGVIIYTVCALAGRSHLSEIFTNFLALMGYWVAIWIAIQLEEHFIFRRRRGYAWEHWNQESKLPVGIAAFVAFAVGWAGAVLCMAQVWYIGPIAKEVGEHGADLGNYVGFSWAALVYPPLRWLELRKFDR